MAHKLRALTSEAESAGERNRLAGAAAAAEDAAVQAAAAAAAAAGKTGVTGPGGGGGGSAGGAPGERRALELAYGTLEYGIRRLGQYCIWLENRVVGRSVGGSCWPRGAGLLF